LGKDSNIANTPILPHISTLKELIDIDIMAYVQAKIKFC
jgi:hypothetical protein